MTTQVPGWQQLLQGYRDRANAYLWQQDMRQLSVLERNILRSCQIGVAVMRDLMQGQLSLRAMSLVFTTLIGFFPLFALSFAVLKSLGVHNAMEPTLLTLLQPLGDRAAVVTGDILGYVDNLRVELIGITSVGLLIYIVLDMMRKIELAFNYIWAIKRGRSLSSRVSEYLFAVIVSPLLLFLSISITSYVNTNFFERFLQNLSYGSLVLSAIAFIAPLLLMSLAFAFAYSFLPNTRVRFGSAFIGGLVTTIIWKLMGSVFQGIFVASARESIYLAFATGIAVMFFIYIGWLVALVGSSIAFYHQNPARTRSGRETNLLSIRQQEERALALAALIIRRFQRGEPPLREEQLADKISHSPVSIEHDLEQLEAIGLVARTDSDPPEFLPARSVNELTLYEIWKALRRLNTSKQPEPDDNQAVELVQEFESQLDQAVEKALGELKFVDDFNSRRT